MVSLSPSFNGFIPFRRFLVRRFLVRRFPLRCLPVRR